MKNEHDEGEFSLKKKWIHAMLYTNYTTCIIRYNGLTTP